MDKTNRDRRRFKVAAVVGIMALSFLAAMVIVWYAPIDFPWNVLLSWGLAIGIGWWGSKLLLRVDRVGRHREE